MHRISRELLWGLIVCFMPLGHQASGDTVQLSPVAVATAEDLGLQDGQFDAFAPLNLGSINNNGYTSLRTALDFDLSSIPTNVTIRSAALVLSVGSVEGDRQLEIHAYPDDGVIQLADFSRDNPAASVLLGNGISGNGFFDLTAPVRAATDEGAAFLGLGLRENPANTGNFTVFDIGISGTSAPQLIVDFAPLPEPSGLRWLAAGAIGLVGTSSRKVQR